MQKCGERHGTLSTRQFFEIKKCVLNWVLSLRLNTAKKTEQWKRKGKQPKRIETHSERLKARIETNKIKDMTHRRVTKTKDLSVREEPVSPGIVSHPFSFVILASL